jgi:RimJ/RimL family protein N-acetyltransferase
MAEIASMSRTLKDGRLVVVRSAHERDAAAMLDCFAACLADGEGLVSIAGERHETEEQRRKTIRNFRDSPFDLLVVADFNGEIVGTLDFNMHQRKRLSHNGDFGMSLLPEWRSCGLGSHLLSALIKWAEVKSQIEKISLRVLASNVRAIILYRKYGFVEEGRCVREVRYENGAYEDELLMARFL